MRLRHVRSASGAPEALFGGWGGGSPPGEAARAGGTSRGGVQGGGSPPRRSPRNFLTHRGPLSVCPFTSCR
eukprot:15439000-Alexandrium_andersonii.AAC.1